MYWPIGAPRIYASSSSRAIRSRIVESDDDAGSREYAEESGSSLTVPGLESEGHSDDGLGPPSATSTPPITPAIKPVEQLDPQRRLSARPPLPGTSSYGFGPDYLDKEPLLALRISRIGHIFAVITATSLTIWQTKVNMFLCVQEQC